MVDILTELRYTISHAPKNNVITKFYCTSGIHGGINSTGGQIKPAAISAGQCCSSIWADKLFVKTTMYEILTYAYTCKLQSFCSLANIYS